jgi:Holliday junction resolvase RusA-like endonuclease
MIAFTVPGQPQGKGRPRIVKIGQFSRLASPKETVAYEGLIAHAAYVAMGANNALVDGPVRVRMTIACSVPASWSQKKQRMALEGSVRPTTKPDVDNVVKAVFDGCNGVVWRDDVQVVELNLTKLYSPAPGVVVEIEPIALAVQRELLGEAA